ncbi:hypothetical protein [Uliginosibacterium aquaticum]|uniref:Uncharacterized protein n=1 Tax=Uliginosibacterium aquaticum TaxID=2731212 RepID=A0ABX2IFW0_9RHOO|nr:hypothetical protein [Uliginosibacterium aquaticum]NSL55610.1 hypothetical protein [Uliginosibacterium aquaticum]
MKNILIVLYILLIFFNSSASASAEAGTFCHKIKNEKTPVAILIDEKNTVSNGPIDLGNIPVPSKLKAEGKVFESKYKVIVFPQNLLKHEEIQIGLTAVLTKTKSMCPNSSSYSVSLLGDFRGGEIRPYKFSADLTWFTQLGGTGHEEEIPDLYRYFDARVVGVFVEPQNK